MFISFRLGNDVIAKARVKKHPHARRVPDLTMTVTTTTMIVAMSAATHYVTLTVTRDKYLFERSAFVLREVARYDVMPRSHRAALTHTHARTHSRFTQS